ncbi:MAG: SDR family NAD(P)-dependent oxidoreductase, partial [Psychrobacillus sp.]
MKRLEGKVAIITGSAQGMGAAHAKLFIENGAKVILTDLNEVKGEEFAAELGENAIFVKQNVASEEDWATVIAKAEETFGPVNVLVNNAGITMAKNMLDVTVEEYRRIVEINQVSVFLGMKTVAASMMKTGGGSIVNISSMNGLVAGAIGYT